LNRFGSCPCVGRLKDWRRIATRYHRFDHIFCSAISIAAIVTFWFSK
jgi:hypothetical protein